MSHTLRTFLLFGLISVLTFATAKAVRAAGTVGDGSPASCTASALEAALAGGGGVNFDCGTDPQTITIAEQTIVTDTVVDGGDLITLSGGDANRLFRVNGPATLTLDHITLSEGRAVEEGGALLVQTGGGLVLRHSTVRDSYVQNSEEGVSYGGGIAIRGTVLIQDSRILSNTAEHGPGGIDNSGGTVTIESSIIEGNRANLFAGIDNGGDMVIRSSVIRNNVAAFGPGGGIAHVNGNLAIRDSIVISNATTYDYGGGIAIYVGNVTIEQTDIISNSAVWGGGGIYVNPNGTPPATVIVRDSQIAFNVTTASLPPIQSINAFGGGIYNGARLTLEGVDVRANKSSSGSGLFSYSIGSAIVRDSTFHDNWSYHIGGGMWLAGDGEQALTNVTVSDNEAGTYGGGILITGTLTLQNATITANRAPDGATIFNQGAVTVSNTILASPVDSENCGFDGVHATVNPLISAGHNLASDDSCLLNSDGDQQETDPLLGGLVENGGPTLTRLPQEGSPAIDNGAACAPADQRGILRPQGETCDIGAVEVGEAPPPLCGGVFGAVADTYLDLANSSANFGQDTLLRLAKGAETDARILLAFDLAAMPDDATIASAFVELAVAEIPSSLPYAVQLFDLTQGWDEGSVTWDGQPVSGNDYGAVSYAAVRGKLRIDVSALAARWLNGEVAETSLLLRPATGDDYTLWLTSRQGATSVDEAPQLIVECGPPAPPPVFDLPSNPPPPPNEQAAGYQELQGDSAISVTVRVEEGAVRFASFQVPIPQEAGGEPVGRAQWFLNEYKELLAIQNPDEELQLIRQSNDGMHLFFRQLHNGIPLLAGELALHMDEANYLSLNGQYVPHVAASDVPALLVEQAEALALASSDGDGVTGDTQLRYVDLGLLGIPEGATHLTWQVNVTQGDSLAKVETVYVDAFSGATVFRVPNTMDNHKPPLDLDLEDGNDNFPSRLCRLDEDDDIGANDAPPESVNANNNFHRVYDYWLNTFDRNSYDDDEEQAEVNIHVQFPPASPGGPNSVNASYGTCDIFLFSRGTTTLDITGHEWTHAVDESEGGLIYANQSGALDESFADIFGYMVDPSSFLIGEGWTSARAPTAGVAGCSATRALRDMSNPPCFGHPDHMLAGTSGDGQGLRAAVPNPNTANDNGSVHTNSGINNKAAFLIIQGGTFNGFQMPGIGREKAQWLFYNVLVNRVTSGTSFQNVRDMTVQEAIDLANAKPPYDHGFSDVRVYFRSTKYTEACIVRNAYAAVGIGNGDANCDGIEDNVDPDADGDWVPNAQDNCPTLFNPGQDNLDGDRLGDACDTDMDDDGRANALDNCPRVANPGWADWNNNGFGDACDDTDGDSVLDSIDNCRVVFNPRQENLDGDVGPMSGDACDPDIDGDNWANALDNCPVHPNPGQEDTTELNVGLPRDLIGDACDLCPLLSTSDNTDLDGDGRANPCDDDDDGDNWKDVDDNCPLIPNESQFDWDDNDIGFACDPQEQEAFGKVVKGVNDKFVEFNQDFLVPIPLCPDCGGNYLPNNFETVINLGLDVQFRAAVVDGLGDVVAKTDVSNVSQVLQFNAAPFAKQRILGVSASADDSLPYSQAPAPDELRYYLIIEPVAGTDLSRPYMLDLAVDGDVKEPDPEAEPKQEPELIYLPRVSNAP